tara:strand:+ start:3902 stop:4111 length:210 start_codon:yes stop_codon:yes gene_type:complete
MQSLHFHVEIAYLSFKKIFKSTRFKETIKIQNSAFKRAVSFYEKKTRTKVGYPFNVNAINIEHSSFAFI